LHLKRVDAGSPLAYDLGPWDYRWAWNLSTLSPPNYQEHIFSETTIPLLDSATFSPSILDSQGP